MTEFPKGTPRTGYTTQFKVKRSDYGIAKKVGEKMLSDEVWVTISFEAVKK